MFRGESSRWTRLALPLALAFGLLVGCRQKMADQPSYTPLQESPFFANGMSSRLPVPGTIARGQLQEDDHFYKGRIGGEFATTFPSEVTFDVLRRGQERYDIYCSPCHGARGEGDGMIVQRGYKRPPSYHTDQLRERPAGYLFDVITNGFGIMPPYAAQVSAADRWAIVAYIRVLQRSQKATLDDVPPSIRQQLLEESGSGGSEESKDGSEGAHE